MSHPWYLGHHMYCDYHFEQYEFECCCDGSKGGWQGALWFWEV